MLYPMQGCNNQALLVQAGSPGSRHLFEGSRSAYRFSALHSGKLLMQPAGWFHHAHARQPEYFDKLLLEAPKPERPSVAETKRRGRLKHG